MKKIESSSKRAFKKEPIYLHKVQEQADFLTRLED